jgi:hypothetical protein
MTAMLIVRLFLITTLIISSQGSTVVSPLILHVTGFSYSMMPDKLKYLNVTKVCGNVPKQNLEREFSSNRFFFSGQSAKYRRS